VADWQAIEKHCRTPVAYGTVKDVRRPDPEINDSLQTFFFAETLKYAQAQAQARCVVPRGTPCAIGRVRALMRAYGKVRFGYMYPAQVSLPALLRPRRAAVGRVRLQYRGASVPDQTE
jgi:hypothetical protein